MHSHCLYGDVFGSTYCDCHTLIRESLRKLAQEEAGVLVYLHQTGAGVRLEKDEAGATHLVSHGRDFMHYAGAAGQQQLQHESGIGAQILSGFGLAHNPAAYQPSAQNRCARGFGIEIVETGSGNRNISDRRCVT
jgi:3,4-dihydroxy 2-butanone 4-phosphate synthase/GTP cyclohydrolase II